MFKLVNKPNKRRVFTHLIHSQQNKMITLLTYIRVLTGFFQYPLPISILVFFTIVFIVYTCKCFADQYKETDFGQDKMKIIKVIRCNEERIIGIHEVIPTDVAEITDDILISPFDMVLMEGELYI